MTREQAKREVDLLDFYLQNHTDDYGEESHTAMMMAIKALERQTCDDAVSRSQVLEQINCWIGSGEYTYANATHYLTRRVQDLPPVNPQPKTTVCEDAISREQAITSLKQGYFDSNLQSAKNDPCVIDAMIDWSIRHIKDLPSVNPQPKVGHWIWQTEDIYRCSECYEDIHVIEVMNMPQYKCCPMCGAKMVEPQESEE